MEKTVHAYLGKISFTAKPFGSGHINSTYKIRTEKGSFVLQRINHQVFKNPEQVMANCIAVTEHLRKKGENALRFLLDDKGSACHQNEEGNYWRMYEFSHGVALDAPETPEDLYQAGIAFGDFQKQLADFPVQTLYETIPDFHNTPSRYEAFRKALAEDRLHRATQVAELVAFLEEKESLAGTLQRMREDGVLPVRVTHNDTKLNNVLLDTATRKPLCVLDLDTVMPGLSAYDFGDAIRFGAATAAEDAGHNSMDLTLFEQYTRGFLSAATTLTPEEIQVLPLSAFIMTLECGMRFLTDYLDGDRYFGISYPEQNLHRARNQLTLAADIERKLPQMDRIIKEIRTP